MTSSLEKADRIIWKVIEITQAVRKGMKYGKAVADPLELYFKAHAGALEKYADEKLQEMPGLNSHSPQHGTRRQSSRYGRGKLKPARSIGK